MHRAGASEAFAASPTLGEGIVRSKRSSATVLARILLDPLTAIPPEAFEARMVIARNFGNTHAYLCDPALVHEAIVRDADHLAKSAEMKRVLGPALGEGLLTADGPVWRWQRRTVAPAFQHERLTTFVPAMIAAAEMTRDRWLRAPGTVDLGHEMMWTTFQIILETMLSGREGIDAAGFERRHSHYLAATPWMFAMALLEAPRWMPFPGRMRAETAARFMRRTIERRVTARRGTGAGSADLIAMLLDAADPETGRAMTDEEVTDNILTFIAAGHETTALALGWTFTLLAAHPACAARLLAEVEAVTEGGPVLPRHVADLAYARQVVNEAMRLYPPAPMIERAVEREIEIAGVRLPAGSVVFVPIYAIHRHKSLWARPDAFDPQRFAPEAVKARHRYAFMPFGAGPRICIGATFAMMEAVAILAVLVKAARLEPTGPTPAAQMHVTLRPKRPLRMRVVPRSPASPHAVTTGGWR